jgi:hypothetical protein
VIFIKFGIGWFTLQELGTFNFYSYELNITSILHEAQTEHQFSQKHFVQDLQYRSHYDLKHLFEGFSNVVNI